MLASLTSIFLTQAGADGGVDGHRVVALVLAALAAFSMSQATPPDDLES
jgi:hypothetical protein